MAPILLCRLCWAATELKGKVPLECPTCHRATTWTSAPKAEEPTCPYVVSYNDKRFLRSLRILADDPDSRLGAKEGD